MLLSPPMKNLNAAGKSKTPHEFWEIRFPLEDATKRLFESTDEILTAGNCQVRITRDITLSFTRSEHRAQEKLTGRVEPILGPGPFNGNKDQNLHNPSPERL